MPRHPIPRPILHAALLAVYMILTATGAARAEGGSKNLPIGPGDGVQFGQVDWPDLPQPVMNTGTGTMSVDLEKVRQSTGIDRGYLNATFEGSWYVRNVPVFGADEYPYPELFSFIPLDVETGTDVSSLDVAITFSQDLITDENQLFTEFFTYEVEPVPLNLGGLPNPVVGPPRDPVDSAIPDPVLDHASAQVIQRGHPNVNAARNQCMPMAIANSLQFLENTTDLELPQSHVPGLAPNGNSDGSLVGDVEAETTRASSVTSRTNEEATGTWGLNGKLKFLAKNGLQDDIRTRHFGRHATSPNGDFTTPDVTQSENGNTASSQPFGKTVSIADLINSLRGGEDCEVVYTYPGQNPGETNGSHAVELVAAGISGGLPWTVTASDLRQTDQGDASDTNLGPGQGFEFSLMSDKDGDGFLEFPDGRELVTAYCQKYVGTPPQTVTQTSSVTDVDDPAGHSCCVDPPGPQLEITRDGSEITIDGEGDGFPLRGWVEASGDFFATSISSVAGFPFVLSTIRGNFNADGSASGVMLTIGVLGELFGTPITYTLDISAPPGQTKRSVAKAAAESTGGLLRVNAGETLTVPPNMLYQVNGFLYNEGTIVISGNAGLRNDGLIENRGTIQVNGQLEGRGILESRGVITNNGTLLQQGPVHLHDGSTSRNFGTWQVNADALLASNGSLQNNATLRLSGRMSNRGTLAGNGTIDIRDGAQLDNLAKLGGTIDNAGRLINVCDGEITGTVTGNAATRFCLLEAIPSGYQTVPVVVTSRVGRAEFSLDVEARTLDYVIELPGLDADGTVTRAQAADDLVSVSIRRGDFLENGSAAFTILGDGADGDLTVDAQRGRLSGRWDASDPSPLTNALLQRLLDGTLYLEIATNAHPGGELRGQMLATNDSTPGFLVAAEALGMLFDRARDGHGIDFQRAGDDYFLTFFTYGDDGAPEWYLAIGKLVGGAFTGELFRFIYDGNDTPPQSGASVGMAEIEFGVTAEAAACDDGTNRTSAVSLATFHWEIDGESGNWCVEPLVVGGAPPSPNFTGHWFAGSADEGWGLTIYQQGDVLFVVLYFYDGSGQPRWMLGSSQSFSNGDTLTMEQFTGFCRDCTPTMLQPQQGGTLKLTFTEPSQTPDGNRTTIDVTYQGPEGGDWTRNDVPIQLLSDPAP